MSSGAYDGLYQANYARGTWPAHASPECQEWCEGLAAHIREHGEPVWERVYEQIADLFPADLPAAEATVRNNIRKLVANR